MWRYCAEKERVKRAYAFFLEAVNGKQARLSTQPSARLSGLSYRRIEALPQVPCEQARSFRSRVEEVGMKGKPLSSATIASTLKHLRNFFLWLSREPGFRSALNPNDANYFTPSDQDVRIATARREKRIATLEEIKHILSLMPAATRIELRNRALIAFALDWAHGRSPASFRLKHLDLDAQTVFHDAREVNTKGRKTFTSTFFPVGP